MRTTLVTLLAMTLLAALAGQAGAANKSQRGYNKAPAYRTVPLRSPRGYLPARKGGTEYDFPRFGSKRWWQLQEDQN